MSLESAIPPIPTSLEARLTQTGLTTCALYNFWIFPICSLVNGLSHIMKFMAGAKISSFPFRNSLVSLVNKLSKIPTAILARVFAPIGAIIITSAQSYKSVVIVSL